MVLRIDIGGETDRERGVGWRKWSRSREGWGGGNGVDQERGGVEEMR